MAERADDRLLRLLGIVAYLDGAGPVSVADLAGRFGTTPAQIQKDVDALWVSGTPGYWPDDLIDFDAASIDRGVVHLTEARGMTRPLRLGTREAVALVAALRAMKATDAVQADPARSAVVESALRKLTDATGEAASAVDVRLAPGGDKQVVAAISSALTNRHRLRIRYVTSSDVVSEREVDPVRLHTQDEFAYLAAWCYRAQAPRTFRVDRILEATETDVPVQAHPGQEPEIDFGALFAGGSSPLATIRFAPRARWFAEEVPVESVRNLPDGDFEVTLRVTNPGWLRSTLIRLAPLVRSVSPEILADDVAGAATAALALYGDGDGAGDGAGHGAGGVRDAATSADQH
ncbi:WYL domain-containing protein [Promicromonospora sp. MEB111]|uniref:helix-turn-helix transcriptional regulator n=1 Tax=Promicromonospora sp. MEB111 TaxID=3040301 RepID=UPI00254B1FC7|nr:WYL domain-containing protein [Promicromonospora sp. MEB111]